MSRKLLLWIFPWMALGLGACATAPPRAVSQACAEWRWIGITSQPEDACPDIPGWEQEPLFASLAADALKPDPYSRDRGLPSAVPSPKVVRELKRFCVYERKPGTSSPPAAAGKLVRIDRDCAAVSVAGDTAQVEDWEDFSSRFLKQAGKPEAPLEIKNRRGVRLAFLDTHPTGVGVPAERPDGKASEHGYTLAHIARNLICSHEDSDVCAALITTRLALPITRFDAVSEEGTSTDEENGGRIGLQSDLAQAIRAEVDEWIGDLHEDDAPRHLVLNLSVAWDGERFDGLDETRIADMQAGTQAIYWALRYAAGFDVLVLAAAGNKSTCATERPLLPAAWEQGAPWDNEPRRAPLLYAVGGVDSMGQPLSNARDRGMPKRAAYGISAVVPALPPGHSTMKYTGTSVSTAVVSSIAAIVWDTLPDRDPETIMNLLYKSGDQLHQNEAKLARTGDKPMPRLADFWFGAAPAAAAQPPAVRRISLCRALAAACEELGDRPGCPMRDLSCPTWTPVANLPSPAPPLSSCHPWVHTQPPFEPCPVCEPPRLSE